MYRRMLAGMSDLHRQTQSSAAQGQVVAQSGTQARERLAQALAGIERIQDDSRRISEAVTIIHDIAERTNLLCFERGDRGRSRRK